MDAQRLGEPLQDRDANCKNWKASAGDRAWSIMKMASVFVVVPSVIIMRKCWPNQNC
jgi:RNA-splicing ligase RtcB